MPQKSMRPVRVQTLIAVLPPFPTSVKVQTYERHLVALLLTLVCTVSAWAQGVPYRIVLRDKGPASFAPGTPGYTALLSEFSQRALERRKRMGFQILVDSTDAPIYDSYLRELQSRGSRVLFTLPWFNSVVLECTEGDSARIRELPFVESVMPVSRRAYQPMMDIDCSPARYGDEALPHEVLRTPALHAAGVLGAGVLMGVIDTGFRWKAMSSLAGHLSVVEEVDLIQGDSSTANNSLDPSSQDSHGSSILSVLAGWQHDTLIGIAPRVSVILAKTEDMRYEHRIEEEAYASIVMYLERRGVDIITSSLGYRTFDEGQDSTLYADLDGSTTWASRSINTAARRGVICVTSAGNDGPSGRTIITPADADSVITIGALSQDGTSPWSKSSWGPTASGRQKPEFSVPGVQVRLQESSNTFARPSGTSISAPIFAGGVALLRELYPTAEPWVLRKALQLSAQRSAQPDSVAGYGAPDILRAASILGPSVGSPVVSTIDSKRSVFACVFSDSPVRAELIIRDPVTGTTSTVTGVRIEEPWYVFPISAEQLFRDVMQARIVVTRAGSLAPASYPRDTSWFAIPRNALIVPCGVRLPGSVTSVDAARLSGGVVVASHPLRAGLDHFSLIGDLPTGVTATIIHITTGAQMACSVDTQSDDRMIIRVPHGLDRGVYLCALRGSDTPVTIPIVVQ